VRDRGSLNSTVYECRRDLTSSSTELEPPNASLPFYSLFREVGICGPGSWNGQSPAQQGIGTPTSRGILEPVPEPKLLLAYSVPEERLMGSSRAAGLVSIALLSTALPIVAADPVVVPGEVPSALAALGDLSRVTAIAVSRDGSRAAAAFPAGKEEDETRVAISGVAEGWMLDGKALVLRWSPSGRTLLALVEKIGRKGRRSAFLDAIDVGEPGRRPRRIVLPESARALDVRSSDSLLVVASEGDLRTFDSETLRSGRIYALAGENLSVAFVPGGERVLVGREDGVVRIDLSAPQGREGMPVESRATADVPIVEIVVSPSAERALARGEDGRLFEIRIEPLEATATGKTASALAWPGTDTPVPIEPAPLRLPEPVLETAPPPPPAPPEPVPEPPSPPIAEESPPASLVEEPVPALPSGQVAGRITGEGRGEVVAVRLLGPDSVIREAKRVFPNPDGTWSADGLAPGTYRVVVDGGPDRVLRSEPAFRTIHVEAGSRVEVDDLEVRGALR
jgi:hypothetical protein